MKIVFATGIYPPDIGGPAGYVFEIAKRLEYNGWFYEVVTYSDVTQNESAIMRVSRSIPPGLRHLVYFFKLLFACQGAEIIYAHDVMAAGVPAAIAAIILGKKFFIRIGGDVLWEKEVKDQLLSVKEFYQQGIHKKYFTFKLCRWVMKNAHKIIVPSTILLDLYKNYYGIGQDKLIFLRNPGWELRG